MFNKNDKEQDTKEHKNSFHIKFKIDKTKIWVFRDTRISGKFIKKSKETTARKKTQ